ncbi:MULTISPECIES: type I secretion system permease/ATPase [unclassified Rhizobium]|uniref:type I secretion system permease/ATPase n=1 Tax=unclassified Rhizobium TaxID=2613769 RepID=UPI0009E98554|nr:MULTISPECIES: type I secretion system permease/ATPase [unclassified Rhizobium]
MSRTGSPTVAFSAETGARRPWLLEALSRCRSAFFGVALVSALINVLFLSGPLFMLEVYDRVLPSRSVPTLVALLVILSGLYACQGMLDLLRNRILARIGAYVDSMASEACFAMTAESPLRSRTSAEGLQPLRDMDQIRSFLGGPGPSALFDLPWIPLYMLICFVFHFWIGVAALTGALVLLCLTLATDLSSRRTSHVATVLSIQKSSMAEATSRNAEAVRVLGMMPHLARRWSGLNGAFVDSQLSLSDVASGFGAMSKAFRMFLQSAILALSAFLFIKGEVSSGMIVASGILVSRALAPVEVSIAHWRTFIAASQSWRRLSKAFGGQVPSERLELPAPVARLDVENLAMVAPGGSSLIVHNAGFSLQAGSALAVVGPSAAGKSTLARVLVRAWPATRGSIRLDGTLLEHFEPQMLSRHIGYLPQDLELLSGSVAENIARFDPAATSEAIIAAAKAAGVHELILRLSDGYDTQIGEGGNVLSTGQRQRIGLARALYGDPFLVVLDEPNSNLDQAGEAALTSAIRSVRARGGIAIVIAHRASALDACDQVMLVSDGQTQMLERKRDLIRPVPASPHPSPDVSPRAGQSGGGAAEDNREGTGPDAGGIVKPLSAMGERA